MSLVGFETLFDRLGTIEVGPRTRGFAVAGESGGEWDSDPAPPDWSLSRAGVEAAAPAASTPAGEDRPVVVGPVSVPCAASGPPRWPVTVTCTGCGQRVIVDAAGYQQLASRLTDRGWRYIARPGEAAWCPDCDRADGQVRDTACPSSAGPITLPASLRTVRPGRTAHRGGHFGEYAAPSAGEAKCA